MTTPLPSRIFLIVIIVIVTIGIFGCRTRTHTTGSYFDIENVKLIKVGKTTKDEVRELLGKPVSRQITRQSHETWNYMYAKSQRRVVPFVPTAGKVTDSKAVGVTFKNNIVSICQVAYKENPNALISSSIPCDKY